MMHACGSFQKLLRTNRLLPLKDVCGLPDRDVESHLDERYKRHTPPAETSRRKWKTQTHVAQYVKLTKVDTFWQLKEYTYQR